MLFQDMITFLIYSIFVYIVNLVYLVTGIFSALTGSLEILGTYKDSKCILCTSAVLNTIILLTIAALLIFTSTQHPTGLTGSSDDHIVIYVGFTDIRIIMIIIIIMFIMSFVGAALSSVLAGVPCQWFPQEESQDLS